MHDTFMFEFYLEYKYFESSNFKLAALNIGIQNELTTL